MNAPADNAETAPVVFQRVTRFYGPVIGLNDVSFRLEPGVTVLFGANGAGKSTVMRLASGQIRPSLGRVSVLGQDAWSTRAKRRQGYCPDVDRFYEEMPGGEFVRLMVQLQGYSPRQARRLAEEALVQVDMLHRASRPLRTYSQGMRQRIKLAQALAHRPQVLLLDEPLAGVDPGGRHALLELFARLGREGKCLLLSTHMLREVETLAQQVLVLVQGRLVAQGTLEQIRQWLEDQPLLLALEADQQRRLAQELIGWEEVLSVQLEGPRVLVRVRQAGSFYEKLTHHAAQAPWQLRRLEPLDVGADAVFRYLNQRP